MNLSQMFNEVQMSLDKGDVKLLKRGEFDSALMQTIRVINAQTEKVNELVKMVRHGNNLELIGDQLEYLIPDDPYYIGLENSFDDISFNELENSITLPAYWEKLLSIYRGGEKLRAVSYDLLKKGGYLTDYYLANNVVYFNLNVMNEELELTFAYRREYTVPKRGVVEYNGMPEYGYQLLLTGIALSLLSRPRFFEPNLYNVYQARYDDAVMSFNKRNLLMTPNMRTLNTFIYGKEIL